MTDERTVMSIVVSTNWPYVTPEQYDAVSEIIRFDEDPPEGAISHTLWFTEGGLIVVDVWRTREDYELFARDRLMPATEQVPGLHGEPTVTFHELHTQAIVHATAAA